jgi:MFS transporter/cyclic nucleotide-binding protein
MGREHGSGHELNDTGGGSPLADAARTLGAVLRSRAIRNLELAWTLGIGADWAVLVVALLVAYDAGGPVLVGLVPLIRMAPGMAMNVLVDPGRFARPERLLFAVNIARVFACALIVAAITVGLTPLVFVGVALEAGVSALVRPTMMAILPAVARTPDELVSSNVANALGEAAGTFVGPLVAGLAIARSGPAPAAGIAAAVFLIAALAILRVRVADAARPTQTERPRGIPIREGLRVLWAHRQAFTVTGSLWAQVAVRGALTAYLAILSVEVLGTGEAGVGLLGAAMGLGGLVGAFVALAVGARRGLAPLHFAALCMWGLPIAIIGIVPVPAVALLALGVVGIGNALIDVAAFTLLQRGIPNRSRMTVFSVFEVGIGVFISLGGIAGSLLVDSVGIEWALVITGLVLPVAALLSWRAARGLDTAALAFTERAAILRRISLFRPLPLAALERLAAGMEPVHYDPGQHLMTEGEWGHEYVIIGSGRADVSAGGRVVNTLGPGDGAGEIGLLRSSPRTATVEAAVPIEGWSIECPTFLAVVTGQDESLTEAWAVVDERLRRGAALSA